MSEEIDRAVVFRIDLASHSLDLSNLPIDKGSSQCTATSQPNNRSVGYRKGAVNPSVALDQELHISSS